MNDMLIELLWESSSLVEECGEPDNLIYSYCGDILDIDEYGNREKVGEFCAKYLDVGRAINEQESIIDILDCHSSSASEYFYPMFGDNAPNFSDVVENVSEGATDGLNLLIVDRVEILPRFRGKYVGLKVLRHMMARFSPGVGGIALKAFPLQLEHESLHEDEKEWREKMALNNFEQDEGLSKVKLRSYYETLGFKTLPDSDFMVFATGWQIPSLEKE